MLVASVADGVTVLACRGGRTLCTADGLKATTDVGEVALGVTVRPRCERYWRNESNLALWRAEKHGFART